LAIDWSVRERGESVTGLAGSFLGRGPFPARPMEIRFLALLQGFTVATGRKAGKRRGRMDTGLAAEDLAA
jgi:hypothetical protein